MFGQHVMNATAARYSYVYNASNTNLLKSVAMIIALLTSMLIICRTAILKMQVFSGFRLSHWDIISEELVTG